MVVIVTVEVYGATDGDSIVGGYATVGVIASGGSVVSDGTMGRVVVRALPDSVVPVTGSVIAISDATGVTLNLPNHPSGSFQQTYAPANTTTHPIDNKVNNNPAQTLLRAGWRSDIAAGAGLATEPGGGGIGLTPTVGIADWGICAPLAGA